MKHFNLYKTRCEPASLNFSEIKSAVFNRQTPQRFNIFHVLSIALPSAFCLRLIENVRKFQSKSLILWNISNDCQRSRFTRAMQKSET